MLKLENQSDIAPLIGRLFLSSLFLVYGYMKLTGYAGTATYMSSLGLPSISVALAVIVELGGGLLILIGYRTRLVALILAIYVLVASFAAHANISDPAQLMQFMKNMAIIGGCLAFVGFGAGAYSVDARK